MSVALKGPQRVVVSDSGYVIVRRQHDAHDDGPFCESSLVTTSSTYSMFFPRAQLWCSSPSHHQFCTPLSARLIGHVIWRSMGSTGEPVTIQYVGRSVMPGPPLVLPDLPIVV